MEIAQGMEHQTHTEVENVHRNCVSSGAHVVCMQ